MPFLKNGSTDLKTINKFKQKLLPFNCLLENSNVNIFDPKGVKLLTHLRLGLSHLSHIAFNIIFKNVYTLYLVYFFNLSLKLTEMQV